MRQRVTAIDYDGLVQQHRVRADYYIDPEIYEDELERIFYRGWVYVGHESEVPPEGKEFRIAHKKVELVANDEVIDNLTFLV